MFNQINHRYWQCLRFWIPEPSMFPGRPWAQVGIATLRFCVGWWPIWMWAGRALVWRNTFGILRRTPRAPQLAAWRSVMQPTAPGSDPAPFTGTLLPGVCADESLSIDFPSPSLLGAHIKLRPAPGNAVYSYFIFSYRAGIANHVLIHSKLPSSTLRPGKTITTALIRHCQAYDISRVILAAGLSDGGHTWPRYGFRPASKMQWTKCKRQVLANLAALLQDPRNSSSLRAALPLLHSSLSSDDPRAIRLLLPLDHKVVTAAGQDTALGRALLAGTRWWAVLDLNDTAARDMAMTAAGMLTYSASP